VGDKQTEEINDAARDITGKELEIKGSKRIEFVIGNKRYNHDFVVARFPVKKDGIVGLDLLRKLGARMDLATGEIEIDGHNLELKIHSSVGKKIFASSHAEKRTTREPKEFADNSKAGRKPERTVYCTAQLMNTSKERLSLRAGTRIADVNDVKRDDARENDVIAGPRVLETRCPKRCNPKVREQSARGPKSREERLNYVRRNQPARPDRRAKATEYRPDQLYPQRRERTARVQETDGQGKAKRAKMVRTI
jgi:hypothetical protein